jgi:glycosyltransferase involved in cell wall biosynthesis
MTILANYFVSRSKEVDLISFDDGSIPPFYHLSAGVKHLPLGILGYSSNRWVGFWSNIRRIRILRKHIKGLSPDLIISFIDLTNVLVILAAWGSGLPVIVAEHSDPAMTSIGPFWRKLRLLAYPRASRIVVLNQKAKSYFADRMQKKTRIIPNPVFIGPDEGASDEPFQAPTIVAMGRFSEEKGFDLLLKAFGLIKDQYPNWNLIIFGDGPLRNELESLTTRLQLDQRVQFYGLVKQPHPLLRKAALFVLPSRFEGLPMALLEAMACGLPVISTEYHSGVREIIEEGVNGLLVPPEDVKALAASMARLMGNEVERKRLAARAGEVLNQFSVKRIGRQWEVLMEEAVNGR